MSKKQKLILYRIILSALLLIAAALAPISGILKIMLFIVPYIAVGYDVLFKAVRNIFSGQVFDENFLMSIATVGAFCIGDYPEATAVMLFYQIGELFQSLAVGKSRKSIAALMDIRPLTAMVIRGGEEVTVSPDEVAIGETVVVKAGEKIPLDGVITKGSASVDTSSLTGESMPVDKAVGDSVISGSVNLNGVIEIKTVSRYSESTVAKILELVENTAAKKAKTENFITRFAKYYTPIVVLFALLLAVVPPLLFSGDLSNWINRALIFLVVSCPCALVVSVPLTFFGGIGGASKQGILIKGAVALEALAAVDTVVFDKTGTLTSGCFYVEKVLPVNISENELLGIAAAAESLSNHPIAECITNAAKNKNSAVNAENIKELAGMGLSALINGKTYYLGNAALMEKAGADYCHGSATGTVIHISEEEKYLGYIVISDRPKAESGTVITSLKNIGIKQTVMLTGDNEYTARTVATALGLDDFFAGLLPADKVSRVEQLKSKSNTVAFVGDGINDAPVLTAADVGIAMGALGSDAAIEAADIVIMDDNLTRILKAISLSRKTMGIVKQNIVFALGVKGLILLLGALGIANMWIAVFGDVGVTVIAILNAMRALNIKS